MLKISAKDRKTRRTSVLEGKLIAPWTNELIDTASQNNRSDRELAIDLRGVTNISGDGEETLYRLHVQGAKFRGADVFIKQVLKQLAQRARRDGSL
jgi:hypothetical protein